MLFVGLFPAEKSLQSCTCYWIGICKTKNNVSGLEKRRGGVEVVIFIGQQLCEINFL